MHVGRASVVYWPGAEGVAAALGELADRSTGWPGLPAPASHRVRIVLAPDDAVFDSVTRGRLPAWGTGAAFPSTNTVVLRRSPDAAQVLRHELAHLALRDAVVRVPLWFDEGYASRAAGEWNRLDALRVNWAVARGRVPSLAQVNRDLRSGASLAGAGYALATSAVLLLERMGGDRGLGPLITTMTSQPDFDAALRQTYAVSLGQFEERWHKELRTRYGWLMFATSFSVFWTTVGGAVLVVWLRRRRRDRTRRAALDDGWVVDIGSPPPS